MSGRKRMDEEARRHQLLEAAFTVARRKGIAAVTLRAVASEAKVSHALVLFHFGKKDRLVGELLDWLIANTAVLRISSDVARFPRAVDRLHALLQQEVVRLSHQPDHTRLFLEFWALGAQHQAIRARIRAELGRYHAAFLAIIEEALHSGPTPPGVTAAGLTAAVVAWIHGCAVQALINPEEFDGDQSLTTVRAVISALGAPELGGGARPSARAKRTPVRSSGAVRNARR